MNTVYAIILPGVKRLPGVSRNETILGLLVIRLFWLVYIVFGQFVILYASDSELTDDSNAVLVGQYGQGAIEFHRLASPDKIAHCHFPFRCQAPSFAAR